MESLEKEPERFTRADQDRLNQLIQKKEAWENRRDVRLRNVVRTQLLPCFTTEVDEEDVRRWSDVLGRYADALRDALEPYDSGVRQG